MDAGGRQRYLDLAIIAGNTHASVAPEIRLLRQERVKHRRYPGPDLVPFIIDARGAWGVEARQWMREIKAQIAVPDKDVAIAALKWRLAAGVQRAIAEAVIQCSTTPRLSRTVFLHRSIHGIASTTQLSQPTTSQPTPTRPSQPPAPTPPPSMLLGL